MSRYKPYPEYKDSGVEWIGEVPAHWEVKRLKNSVSSCRNGIWGSDALGDGNDIPCVRVADFCRDSLTIELDSPTLRSLTPTERGNRVLKRGDLVLEKSGGGEKQPVGAVMLYDHDTEAVCSNFTARMVLKDGMNPSFWRYVHAAGYANQLNVPSIKQTSGIQNLDQHSYLSEQFSFPDSDEQSQIATFLDRETTRIDILVEKKQRFIELLEEKRQAVITQAVTKGLDPNVPMKDSGVEWIGEVPAHWEVKRLGHVGDIFKGSGGNKSDQTEEGVPCLRYGEIYTRYDSFLEKPVNYVKPESASAYTPLQLGDVVFTASGEDVSEIGKAVAVMFDGPLVCGGDTIILRPRWHANHSTKFIGYLANAVPVAAQKSVSGTGFTVVHISGGKIKEIRMAWPRSDEQHQIATFLDRETTRFDTLIEKTRESIEFLKERRSALITAAVTGKIDVREEAA